MHAKRDIKMRLCAALCAALVVVLVCGLAPSAAFAERGESAGFNLTAGELSAQNDAQNNPPTLAKGVASTSYEQAMMGNVFYYDPAPLFADAP